MNSIFLSIGSNLGSRFNNIKKCIRKIEEVEGITLISCSRIYETKPMYNLEQPEFLNLVIKIKSSIKPNELLMIFKRIESFLGRDLNAPANSSRIIDIDILTYGKLKIDTKNLNIPHKKIQDRLFVLKPWTDIEPNYKLPQSNKTISCLISSLDIDTNIVKLYSKSL
tara:strand:+ start:858 stop:1358 length:501 start_codon:yes stop_codon:yes gene_type:complete